MNIVAIVQARTGSTRLPGKILLPLRGKPLLERMLERVHAATQLDRIVVATTDSADDDRVRDLCARIGVPVFSGHPTDLLDRHYRAGLAFAADAVVKIPSDCPLIDPRVIDRVVHHFRDRAGEIDYVSNLHPATYPDGNDVEVMTMPALECAWHAADRDFEREHTTPYLWDRVGQFRIDNVTWESGLDFSMTHRFTIDYAEDYDFIDAVYERLHREGASPFSLEDILELLTLSPEIYRINAHYAGVNWYRHHLDELRTVGTHETVEAIA